MSSGKHRAFYTPAEVALHNAKDDCWVSFFHKVYDLTTLLSEDHGTLAEPILLNAGKDITHWFDAESRDVKHRVDPETNLRVPHTPQGRFIHVPPSDPLSTWRTDFGKAWWKDDKYCIGTLSAKTRWLRVVNTMTSQSDLLEVASEETLNEIQDRYVEYNAHAGSYTWKALFEGEFRPLDMTQTLEANGVRDESEEFARLNMDPDEFIPVIHVYFNDDLTVL
mmetsp:Transcript_112816/g.313630  ORF Transcript_112816/g.313630 Transcript_112816/m.313630 type:complete len:222 (-) Transcript_112816:82-747(-)